jgi:CubicO group peptidase (beta-lactamase class C family)
MDELRMRSIVASVLERWPSAGLAVAVVRDGEPPWFLGHGVADMSSGAPVTPETVFRIGSLTKTITAIAVLQLLEQGLVDLDAPANDYLRTFRLVPVKTGLQPATMRHLLTHTAGIGYWPRWSDLLRPGVGSGVSARSGRPLAELLRRGLPIEVQPGTKWAYSNHGFAALGQIVEDVTGEPFGRYLHDHVFEPLGMAHSDVLRPDPGTASLATGYMLGRRGLRPVTYREVPLAAGGGVSSTPADMARFLAALVGGGSNARGVVLKPATVASLFAPHFQPDPRVPGMGLGFELETLGGHRLATKSGVLSGFLSYLALAPDDRLGVLVLANTGSLSGQGTPEPAATALLHHLLDVPDGASRDDIASRPDVWSDICGWYGMEPGPLTNLFDRLAFGAGVEVTVRHGQLLLRPLSLIPSMRRGFRLRPDDDDDAYVFRADLASVGMGTYRVAFRPAEDGTTGWRFEGLGLSLRQRPEARHPRRLLLGLVPGVVTVLGTWYVIRTTRRRIDQARRGNPSGSTPRTAGSPRQSNGGASPSASRTTGTTGSVRCRPPSAVWVSCSTRARCSMTPRTSSGAKAATCARSRSRRPPIDPMW